MGPFHQHRWTEVNRYAVPPLPAGTEVEGFGAVMLERLLQAQQGYTVIELRCEECGDVTERRLPGKAT